MLKSYLRPDRNLNTRLRELEEKAEQAAVSGSGAPFLNQAGDICAAAGQMGFALEYYGRAIDAMIQSDRFDAAAAVCKKVVRLYPEVVRAHCTLAWIAIANGFSAEARNHASVYVDAAKRAGRENLALNQIRRMSAAAENDQLRMSLGELLMALGDDQTADHFFGEALRDRNQDGQLPLGATDPTDETREMARRAALLGPRQLGY